MRSVPGWVSALLVTGELGALLWFERRRPLRPATESAFVRRGRNLTVAALAALPVAFIERPLALALTDTVRARRWGLLGRTALHPVVETVAAVVLLDYTLYLWHRATHRVPFLWRFHVVHHVDRDCDVTTALRFHPGELTLSVGWRAAQLLAIGPSPFAYSLWQLLLVLSILFHHSDVRLPARWERRIGRLIVTPRVHGIHHAAVERLANGNWSSGLSGWDRLHGTYVDDVRQDAFAIGIPAYRADADAALGAILALPFGPQRDACRDEPDGAAGRQSRP